MKPARIQQLTFDRLLGGRRKGGRKKSPSSGVSHLKRAAVSGRVPVHVTARVREGLPNLRHPGVLELWWRCCRKVRERRSGTGWFHLVEYSLQGNHIHLLAEASDRKALSNALNGLFVRFAKGLNKLLRRRGKVFAERYHDRLLGTPREVYNALRYVLENARKHGVWLRKGRPDPFSSGPWFEGWKDYVRDGWLGWTGPVARATSWLLTTGWKRHGLLEVRWAWDRTPG
jgi:REP element-mobilizing transposase RayT